MLSMIILGLVWKPKWWIHRPQKHLESTELFNGHFLIFFINPHKLLSHLKLEYFLTLIPIYNTLVMFKYHSLSVSFIYIDQDIYASLIRLCFSFVPRNSAATFKYLKIALLFEIIYNLQSEALSSKNEKE